MTISSRFTSIPSIRATMLNYAQNYGEFVTITIENMSEEHHNIEHGDVATDMECELGSWPKRNPLLRPKMSKDEPLKDFAMIAVSAVRALMKCSRSSALRSSFRAARR
jgi:dihydroxyacetone kinase-like predicted kinase